MGTTMSYMAYAEDKCPVDHANMSKEELQGLMAQYKRTGTLQTQTTAAGAEAAAAAAAEKKETTGSCPVDHKNLSKEQTSAYLGSKGSPKSTVYDVYGQELDRANLMPSTPNQLPSPGQKEPLSTDRVKSNIPKAGESEGETWTYPSAQMFFNALKRKGKAQDVDESDMDSVVAVHNDMNEKTWTQVMNWEKRFHCDCANPKLKRFMGKPSELSPAARFRVWFRGYPMPFDRHDWIIDRCGKEEVRYIIDYYYRDKVDPIEIHVRPALDSVDSIFDRVRHTAATLRDTIAGVTQSSATMDAPDSSLSAFVAGEELDEEEFSFLSSLNAKNIQDIAADVNKRCDNLRHVFRDVGDDPEKMERANVSVNYCMAQRICKRQATDFMSALEGGGDEAHAYSRMTSCLQRFHIVARRALLEASGVKQTGPEFPAQPTPSASSVK